MHVKQECLSKVLIKVMIIYFKLSSHIGNEFATVVSCLGGPCGNDLIHGNLRKFKIEEFIAKKEKNTAHKSGFINF